MPAMDPVAPEFSQGHGAHVRTHRLCNLQQRQSTQHAMFRRSVHSDWTTCVPIDKAVGSSSLVSTGNPWLD